MEISLAGREVKQPANEAQRQLDLDRSRQAEPSINPCDFRI